MLNAGAGEIAALSKALCWSASVMAFKKERIGIRDTLGAVIAVAGSALLCL